jgi:hypothetical protein
VSFKLRPPNLGFHFVPAPQHFVTSFQQSVTSSFSTAPSRVKSEADTEFEIGPTQNDTQPMKQTATMNRLPGCDRTTARSEMALFASLGLAGLLMVALATVEMSGFVAGSDRIAAALNGQPSVATAEPDGGSKTAATNRVSPATERANVPLQVPGKV